MKLSDFLGTENLARAVDKAVGIFSPEAYAKRTRIREQVRLYDGATKGRRGAGFRKLQDGPRDGIKSLATLRQRSRDFSRNNGYAVKAVNAIASNTIGTGIVLELKGTRANSRDLPLKDAWKSWSESTDCDFAGLTTFAGIQELVMKGLAESGEVFIRRRILDSKYFKRTGKIPLKLQVLEPEYLADSKDSYSYKGNQNEVVSGIEFTPEGERVAYHFYKRHPSLGGTIETVRVPADEVIHLFRLDRPDQIRGVPWGAPVLLNLMDLDGYEDAEILRRKIAACYAAFVTEPEIDDTIGKPEEENALIDRMEPGMIEVLPQGKTVTFGTPPQVTGYAEFPTSILHKISAGYQVPYSVLTGDFTQVNFSSGRMGWLEFQRLIEQWRWNMIVPRMLDPIFGWFSFVSELVGISAKPYTKTWTAPRREMIDPLKEIQAILLGVKGGLQSLPEAIRELGYDPDEVIEQIKEHNSKLDSAGVILDSDPRQDPKRLAAKKVAGQKESG